MRDIPRPENAGPEPDEERPPSASTAAALTEQTSAATVLQLQRTVGNRAVGQLLARKEKPQTRLERLDQLLGKFDVDEGAVIAHLGTLDDAEKRIVLRDYRARIASPLNVSEMVRAVKLLGPPLATKIAWVAAAGSVDYWDIRPLIVDPNVKQAERNALRTNPWRDWFVGICNNASMKQAVVDLKFDLPNQLAYIAGEMDADYDDIKSFLKAKTVTDFDRQRLKTEEWRKWFFEICTQATLRDVLVDLRFGLWTSLDWLLRKGTNTVFISDVMRVNRRPELAALVNDVQMIARIRSAMGANGVRMVDRQQVERAKADLMPDFRKAVDLIPEPRLHELAKDGPWLAREAPGLGDDRFAYLAACVMLVARYAPRARTEALRVISTELLDRETALRMIAKPVQVVIVPRDKMMTDLDEFRSLLTSDSGGGPGNTFDGRQWAHVRGVGNVVSGGKTYAAITEENLLGGLPDPKAYDAPRDAKGKVVGTAGTPGGGYAVGYSTTSHEFAHVLHANGLSAAQKKLISKHYNAKRKATETKETLTDNVWPDGPRISPTAPPDWVAAGWTDAKWIAKVAEIAEASRKYYENYSAQNEMEYFAQLSNAYLGTNLGSDPTTLQPRNNGRAWIVVNEDTEMLALLDKLYKHRTINDIDAGGALVASGLCTNPAPGPPPPPPGPPPPGPSPPGGGP